MKYKVLINLLLISLLLAGAACKKDETTPDPPPVQDGGVYIINEGNYNWSNGTIDYYRFANSTLTGDIFGSVNHHALGDVVQSMSISNGRGYIVVNNSGKVEVVNISDFSSAGTITGLTSPRYLLPVGNNKAYVTDLYSNSINVVDISMFQKTGQIPLHGSTEEMVLSGTTVYVTNTRTSYAYLLDVTTNTLTDSIAVGYAANSIRMDKNGKIWVMCAGDQAQSINAGIYQIDPQTKAVIKTFPLGNSLNIWDKITMNGSSDIIYYLNSGVWKLDITATSLPSSALIAQGSKLFHGLGADPTTGTIYVSDAIDYVQQGKVYRYTADGTYVDSFSAGIIPAGFCFR
jgi:hypothetical protein